MRLENIENKEQALHDFFIWLFNDKSIINKSVTLFKEIDYTLCTDYIDANIYFPQQIKEFFDSKPMQRLSKITQLGLSINQNSNLYHNRLDHSKGVYNKKVEEFFYNYQNTSWKEFIEKNNLKLYLIASLIKSAGHDIGHLPYSHAMEDYLLNKRGAHEEIGKKIMLETSEITSILNKISPELSSKLSMLYDKDILNFSNHDESNYDNDRLDYLIRDSLYYGTSNYMPLQKYETIKVKTDENNIPLNNSDLSIIKDDFGNATIDVYNFSSLDEIERMLTLRKNMYKKIYTCPTSSSNEYCIKNFIEAFLETPSNVGTQLRKYFLSLKDKNIEDIDLNSFIDFTEIDLYTNLIEIAESHEDENIADLATIILPKMNALLKMAYSQLKLYDKNSQITDKDRQFLYLLKGLISGDSKLSKKLKDDNFINENVILLQDTINSDLTDKEKEFIVCKKIKLNAYKKTQPIYIKDSTDRIFELSNHPNKKVDWSKQKKILTSNFICIPYLRYKKVPEQVIEKIVKYKLHTNDIFSKTNTEHSNKTNMNPLKTDHNIEDLFLNR